MKVIISLLFVLLLIPASNLVFSHQDGCHRWHSCPSDSGSYTCGDKGYCSECPNNKYCEAGHPRTSSESSKSKQTIPKQTIPETNYHSTPQHVIPDWIKNNAGWWADGLISDQDFIQGIQMLITNEIMKIEQIQTEFDILQNSYTLPKYREIKDIEISGKVPDFQPGIRVTITIMKPDGTRMNQSFPVIDITNDGTTDGWYKGIIQITHDDPFGTYQITGSYKNNEIPTTSFIVEDPKSIPVWIKNNAGWWADETISDNEFVSGIQFLILNDIIQISQDSESQCGGTSSCLVTMVEQIVDGDTIYVKGNKIRLALVNTPEIGEEGYREATEFTAKLCPVGSVIIIDQDDIQLYDGYQRMIGKVFCDGKNLNAELLENSHAEILIPFCYESEFSKESWAKQFGC